MVIFFVLLFTSCLAPSESPKQPSHVTNPTLQPTNALKVDVDALLQYQNWKRQRAFVLDALSFTMPESCQLRSLKLVDDQISLKVWAFRLQDLLHLQAKLDDSGYFPNMEDMSIEVFEQDMETLYQFSYEGTFALPAVDDGFPVTSKESFFQKLPATSSKQLMQRIIRQSKKHGLVIQQLHQAKKRAYRKNISILPFTLTLQGGFHDVTHFLDIISRQKGPVQLHQLLVDIVTADSSGTVLSVNVDLWFFQGAGPQSDDKHQQKVSTHGFNPVGKFDPFTSILDSPVLHHPAKNHPPVERYDAHDYRLRAVLEMSPMAKSIALLTDPVGNHHFLRTGEVFGKEKRKLESLSQDHFSWSEMSIDVDGKQTERSGSTNLYGTPLSTTPFEVANSPKGKNDLLGLRCHEADIHALLTLISEPSGINFVAGPGMQKAVSFQLDQLPAKRLFDLVSSANHLQLSEKDGIVRIAQKSVLANKQSGFSKAQIMSMSFQRVELGALIRLFREVSKQNIIWPAALSQKISIRLIEVPWDQALVAVADVSGLEVMWGKDAIVVRKKL